jgi:cytochrome c-type biogenesis protein
MTESTLVLALVAGVASFLSPCMLPVIPAFLAQLAGTSLGASDTRRRDVFLGAASFVVGFSVVFAAMGVALSTPCSQGRRRRYWPGSHGPRASS